MGDSPGEQQQGTNSSCEWLETSCLPVRTRVSHSQSVCPTVPAVSGGSTATPHGSGGILHNFDQDKQSPNKGAAKSILPVAPTPQQQGGC